MSYLKTQIVKQLDRLPENTLKQVADFINFLAWRNSTHKNFQQEEDIVWLETDLSNLNEYEPYEWQAGELEQGSPVDSIIQTEPRVNKIGTALVFQSTPIDDMEAFVERAREERINDIIADYEGSL